ncbi:bifunctional hydroxymethylpyrimidine kinase/phosphomethylpyrimidine kinase [Persephonella atlantica]|uniref:hydroxymethylpyrimidine kinase n=1 Tax=Persephonella atlantica TaxID=2699429 RepID=A0ABS1GJB9_9AQUI|nr:bifunctional hydroxymethylpyrimidine kinase/phosphomethylpyrimidine kinase [Persephonella atlantica]MBK3332847.1 bifunctional hydroxymethylpyrimidine kinase/phosphomethylpyrimidine kinase [Persephonella atlantica]
MIYRALTIAGSDNSGGAGIQADLKVFSAFGVYGMSAVTAITVQNSLGVQQSVPVPPDTVFHQIESVATDIGIDAFKTGMLQTEENVLAVSEAVKRFKMKNFVCDTVIKSKNGTYLLDKNAVNSFIKKIIPLTEIITPNTDEAEVLTGIKIKTIQDMKRVAKELVKMGANIAVIKGGHLPQEDTITDVVYDGREYLLLRYPLVKTKNTHGTGCTFSAAITACLSKGLSPLKAIRVARAYVQGAIENALSTGKGTGSLNHFWTVT